MKGSRTPSQSKIVDAQRAVRSVVHDAQNDIVLDLRCVHIAENYIISAALDCFQTYAPDVAVLSLYAVAVATSAGESALHAPVITGNRSGLEWSEHAEETNQRENKQSREENDSGLHNEYLPFNQWAVPLSYGLIIPYFAGKVYSQNAQTCDRFSACFCANRAAAHATLHHFNA